MSTSLDTISFVEFILLFREKSTVPCQWIGVKICHALSFGEENPRLTQTDLGRPKWFGGVGANVFPSVEYT